MEKISNILGDFTGDPIFQILSLFVGLLGVVLAIIFFFKSKKKRKPFFAIRSFNIISDKIKMIEKINITYDNQPIENLTVSKIAIWNGGNETINSSDFAQNDSLRIISLDDIQIYDAKIIYESHNTCSATISLNINNILIYFDYFDYKQGIVIQVTHSGKKSSDLVIAGTVKGVGKIQDKEVGLGDLLIIKLLSTLLPFSRKLQNRRFRNLFGWTTLLLGILLIVIGYIFASDTEKSFVYAFGLTYGFFGFVFIMIRNTLPKGFEEIFEK